LRTQGKVRKHESQANVFYISQVVLNFRRVLIENILQERQTAHWHS